MAQNEVLRRERDKLAATGAGAAAGAYEGVGMRAAAERQPAEWPPVQAPPGQSPYGASGSLFILFCRSLFLSSCTGERVAKVSGLMGGGKHAGMRAPPQMMQVGMNGRGLMPYDEGTSVCEA